MKGAIVKKLSDLASHSGSGKTSRLHGKMPTQDATASFISTKHLSTVCRSALCLKIHLDDVISLGYIHLSGLCII